MSLLRRTPSACAVLLAVTAIAPAGAQRPAPSTGSVPLTAAGTPGTLPLPDAPSYTSALAMPPVAMPLLASQPLPTPAPEEPASSSSPAGYSAPLPAAEAPLYAWSLLPAALGPQKTKAPIQPPPPEVDADGNPIPLERRQPQRILGIMPNFRTVSAGSRPHPPGWKYNFTVATHQALDYSTFIFLGLTTVSAEGINAHPALGKGVEGFGNYLWRGFFDKTDNTYLSAWLLASLLHEDTRYYPLGNGHRIATRTLYVISRQVVTRTYGGHDTFNFAGLGGKVLTQYISRYYYPSGSTTFSALATKFAYSAMRDIGFSAIREFYPDAAAHFIRKHREKLARAQAAAIAQQPASTQR